MQGVGGRDSLKSPTTGKRRRREEGPKEKSQAWPVDQPGGGGRGKSAASERKSFRWLGGRKKTFLSRAQGEKCEGSRRIPTLYAPGEKSSQVRGKKGGKGRKGA